MYADQRSHSRHRKRQSSRLTSLTHSRTQRIAFGVETVYYFASEQVEGRDTRRHRDGIAVVRTRMGNGPLLRGIVDGHHVSAAAKRAHRKAPADNLAERCKIRLDTVDLSLIHISEPTRL